MEYEIGSMICEKATTTFCNGPLPAGRKYVVVVFACTKGGCKEGIGVRFKTKPEAESPIALIVGLAVAGVVILVLVVVVVVLIRRRRPHSRPPSETSSSGEELFDIEKERPVKMIEFNNHIADLHKDSNLRFSQEYEDLKALSPNSPMIHSEMDGNRVKNRYVNILPFDHSRVKLLPLEEDPDNGVDTSDYINANFIPGYKGPREYIATQGPMTGTIADFWRMIWEQHSTLIVMLSDLQEKGRPKVDQYWPPNPLEPVNYGEIVVELTSVSQLNKFIIRIFKLTLGKEDRLVRQYFIPGWEDYSANLTPEDVISFIQTIRKEIHPAADCGPVVVHCSAGVGRSGTFIALDVFQQWVDDHQLNEELDVFEFVLKMRNNRPHMVQTEKQYIFIHDTLNVMIEKRKLILCPPEENIYANDSVCENKGFEPDEENLYQNVSSMKAANTPTTVL
ncbi:tyrosine-protein phosphatase 10D-like [Gigantopelta aegis]|uniref:tyrosine-protein phosphatase 10D-like n=1 Tax=Gigantopelta aegis TaxID=1735272 RepID=UPI001B88DB0B|nr:tyrosine-protein phosphatase 10D-like [Gigantopelta aegis]